LERHHNVLISDEALRAAVKLTDMYVTDRMRPDKAIDAIDEACAHMQAVTEYSPVTAELIRQRLNMLKELARIEREAPSRAQEPVAQGGFSALERFGAELEALFVGAPVPVAANGESPKPEPEPRVPRAASLAPLEADLARQLMQEGVVVRGHDIARVVSLMAGVDADWEAEETR
jgi:ATP-dependent Clp protease ATP-binding subunit ClpA